VSLSPLRSLSHADEHSVLSTERRFLALGTDISPGNGIGSFTTQFLAGVGRINPGRLGTALALSASPDLKMPQGWSLCRAHGRLRYAMKAMVLARRQRPSEILVFHLSIMPVAFIAAWLASARVTLVAYGWELTFNRRKVDRWCGYRADRIIAVSRMTALEVERLFRDKRSRCFGEVQVLHPTWDHHNSTADQTRRFAARETFGFAQDEVVMLTVGRMDPAERCKGHDRVLDVLPALLASNPNLRYLIVGEGKDQTRLVERSEALGLADRVIFAGFVENVADCFAACDLYVMPSTQEGFGIVFLEALASGRPVVAGGIDGSIEAILWGELGFLCDPLDPRSVEETIRKAINALDGPDPRVDASSLQSQVELRFGTAAFDQNLTVLFGLCDNSSDSTNAKRDSQRTEGIDGIPRVSG
jgi:phosphatidylinositol alpha-1,6-mannosyltransferase